MRYPIYITDVADALVLLIRSTVGGTFDLYGPKGYTYRRLVELFSYATMSPCHITSLPPPLFWLYGKVFPELRKSPFPYDTILQLLESERIDPNQLNLKDLGIHKPETVEDQMLQITRRYRRTPDFGLPLVFPESLLEDSTKASYSTRHASIMTESKLF